VSVVSQTWTLNPACVTMHHSDTDINNTNGRQEREDHSSEYTARFDFLDYNLP